MKSSLGKIIVVSIVFVLFLSSMVGYAIYRPSVTFTVTHELVGPDEEAVALLYRHNVSLRRIQDAVRQSGKDVDQISWMGMSLLYIAVKQNRMDVATWLLEQGANPNGIDRSVVPLDEAIEKENLDMVKLLLEFGADPDFEMNYNLTPRKVAQKVGNAAIIGLLANIQYFDRDGPASSSNAKPLGD